VRSREHFSLLNVVIAESTCFYIDCPQQSFLKNPPSNFDVETTILNVDAAAQWTREAKGFKKVDSATAAGDGALIVQRLSPKRWQSMLVHPSKLPYGGEVRA